MSNLIDTLSMTIRLAGRQLGSIMLAYGVMALFLLTGYGALVFAIAATLSNRYGSVAAAVMIGLASLMLALIVYIWTSYRVRRFRRRQHLRAAVGSVQRSVIGTAIPVIVRASPIASLIAVAAAAAFLTRSVQKHR